MKVILLKIIKGSTEEAAFPEKLIAVVIPVFKNAEKENVKNYRLISILPIFFFKVLERIMDNRLYEYFMNNNLIHENQFCFQTCSTDHAILEATQDIAQNFENSNFTLGIYIDIVNVLDIVDHQIILK